MCAGGLAGETGLLVANGSMGLSGLRLGACCALGRNSQLTIELKRWEERSENECIQGYLVAMQ